MNTLDKHYTINTAIRYAVMCLYPEECANMFDSYDKWIISEKKCALLVIWFDTFIAGVLPEITLLKILMTTFLSYVRLTLAKSLRINVMEYTLYISN